ncbi:hypothetical protein GcC1_122019 [Golovinomyces cichoracearum]|uniref:SWIM-type domain-containing protein n=1 Tax=Golovinomyces cichoracearum TaxID=62708 RepID=A0A420I6S2_9PEZI|nr:hypothetical protein GcC1_122019 [Golovinomyces cichoracearum]
MREAINVIPFIHPYALNLILNEKAKLPLKQANPLPFPCRCSVSQCLGITCFHNIRKRQQTTGLLALSDIDCHWHYDRYSHGQISNQDSCRILLNPHKVNGKGRPQGSIKRLPSAAEVAKSDNKNRKGYGASSNRRDLSLFEHEAIYLPLSSAPPRLEIAPLPKEKSRLSYSLTPAVVDREKNETMYTSITASTTSTASTPSISALPPTSAALSRCSTILLGVDRGAGDNNCYQPRTLRERACMRSIKIGALGSAVNVDMLDDNEETDEHELLNEDNHGGEGKFAWDMY